MCISDNSNCESRNAEFFDNTFPFKNSSCGVASSSHTIPVSESMFAPSFVLKLRRSKRPRTESNFGPDFITDFLIKSSNMEKITDDLVFIYLIEEDPKTYNEVVTFIIAIF